ncbi:MAG: glycerate kinase [Firmicutes bacterium]|jgi:hydroxypyruvate reductase|nr:glycerate kinase [Bacillota bacterium]MDH7495816.1 glycerate kinase [Bacillota bacterium]
MTSETASDRSGTTRVTDGLRRDALEILNEALAAVDPYEAIRRIVRRKGNVLEVGARSYDLSRIDRVIVIGAGKASARMALAVEETLGDRITAGLVNVKYGHSETLTKVRVREAGHPVPDAAGVEGAREMLELARDAGEDDLVICLISGGGSSLMPVPAPGIELLDKQRVTQALLSCGATIHEINAVRKHISLVKGGGFARTAAPAQVVSLILSDVIGDDLDVIASGPTVPDTSTFVGAWEVMQRHGVLDRIPDAVRRRIEAGVRGEVPETPKPGDPLFGNVANVIVASNAIAMDAAARAAERLGYHSLVLSSCVQGEAREVGRVMAAIARELSRHDRPTAKPACVLAGGETTVTLRGTGLGGRNQELALSAALDIEGMTDVVLMAVGTDGTDGPTDAAGAMVFGDTAVRAREAGMAPSAYLENNDSYHFFKALGDLVVTGPTRTNVMDIVLILAR